MGRTRGSAGRAVHDFCLVTDLITSRIQIFHRQRVFLGCSINSIVLLRIEVLNVHRVAYCSFLALCGARYQFRHRPGIGVAVVLN